MVDTAAENTATKTPEKLQKDPGKTPEPSQLREWWLRRSPADPSRVELLLRWDDGEKAVLLGAAAAYDLSDRLLTQAAEIGNRKEADPPPLP